MEQRRFDALARAMGAETTRRTGIGAALAAVAGALSGLAAPGMASAAGKKDRPARPSGPCGDRSAKANRCTKDNECCTGYCKPAGKKKVGRCRCAPDGYDCTKKTTCCHGLTCQDGACAPKPSTPIATGAACAQGDVCANPSATCTAYSGGSPAGTYCLLQNGAACAASTDCVNAYCGASVCGLRPTGWEYQTAFSDSQTGGAYVLESAVNGLTVYVGAYGQGVTAWTRPSTTGSGATTWTNAATIAAPGKAPGDVKNVAGLALSAQTGALMASDSYDTYATSMFSGAGTSWSYATQFVPTPSDASGALAITQDGLSLYMADYNNSCVTIFTRLDATSTTWTQGASFANSGSEALSSPGGIALSPDDLALYVADSTNNRVSIWTRPSTASQTWTYATSFGAYGTGTGQFQTPWGLALAPNGLTLWIADTFNNRVQVWTRPDTLTQTWTYSTAFGALGDGNGQFSSPRDVAVSEGGKNVYVADASNNRVSVWVEL